MAQKKDSVKMKGPNDIPGVRTKGRSFLMADPTPTTDEGGYYIYPAENVYSGFFQKEGKPLLKRLKWYRCKDKEEFDRLRSMCRARHVKFLDTRNPPEDVL